MAQQTSSSARALYHAAAVATAIAGMLHLMLGPNSLGFNFNQGILFIVGGIAQIFWIIPVVRRWGIPWYAIGIGGTVVFIALWVITRMPGNPITGRGGPADNPIAVTIEVMQAAFVGLAAAIIAYESKTKSKLVATNASEKPKSGKQVPILAGIVVALVLSGLFVLPMSMGQPPGPPPGQGGPQVGGQIGTPTQVGASTDQTCNITPSLIEVEGTPQQTEGPYFVDGMPERSDIRSDLSDGSVQEGIPLSLVINVYDVDDGSEDLCIPVRSAQVDIWHANFQGVYSVVQEQGTVGKNFLRGYQITDDNGAVQFSTVYPGWYEGRAIHIHVKVRTLDGSEGAFEWTSQFYLPDSITGQVHTQSPYSTHGQPGITNYEDGIFTGASTDGLVQSNAGEHLMLDLSGDSEQGYTGTFNIVVEMG
jgi:protocatechuate 3,4-dioxygenase beta subunit